MLLKNGAALEVEDWFGATPLCKAADKGHVDAVEALLMGGAGMARMRK